MKWTLNHSHILPISIHIDNGFCLRKLESISNTLFNTKKISNKGTLDEVRLELLDFDETM